VTERSSPQVHEDLVLHIQGPVARLELAEPSRGSPLNLETVGQLAAALERVRDADAHVLVLRSRGNRFCVGGDLAAMASAADPSTYVEALADLLHEVIDGLHRLDGVVVSVVQGVAAGAGFPLAAAADIIVAGRSATFTMAYTKVGLTPDGGSSLLTATLGLHRTLYAALLNPVLTANEAHVAGLVSSVQPDDAVDDEVERMVATLLTGSRRAQVEAKRLIRRQAMMDPRTALQVEALTIRAAAGGPDGREGIQAFLDKRRPDFASGGSQPVS